jgi:REP element-mobilizing transposase RayT
MSDRFKIYNQQGVYFLTFQVVGWVDIFSRKLYRDIIIDSFIYCKKYKNLKIHAYVIMSNHVHCVLSTDDNLSNIVRDFKRHTSTKILKEFKGYFESRRAWMDIVFNYHGKYNSRNNKYQFWTHENHAVELTSNRMIDNVINYIHKNPVKAGVVENEIDYIYSSARSFTEMDCLIKVDPL